MINNHYNKGKIRHELFVMPQEVSAMNGGLCKALPIVGTRIGLIEETNGFTGAVVLADTMVMAAENIIEHIKRLPGYKEEQNRVPLNETKGRWVSLHEAARIRKLTKKTLSNYRSQGTQNSDGLSGIDVMKYYWRRSRPKSPTEYFIPENELP